MLFNESVAVRKVAGYDKPISAVSQLIKTNKLLLLAVTMDPCRSLYSFSGLVALLSLD
jgi:hypothetical protein